MIHIAKIVKAIIALFLFVFLGYTLYYTFYEVDKNLAIGLLSATIAILSVYFGFTSDRMMRATSSSAFNRTLSDINIRRLTLRDKLEQYQDLVASRANRQVLQLATSDYVRYHSYSIWICLGYLKSAMDFEEFFKKKEKEDLIHEIDCLLIDFGNGKTAFSIAISPNYKQQLQRMYDLISEIDIFNDKRERVDRLQHNLGYLKDEGPTAVQGF